MFVVVYRGLINELLAKELLIGVLKQQNAGFGKSAAEEKLGKQAEQNKDEYTEIF